MAATQSTTATDYGFEPTLCERIKVRKRSAAQKGTGRNTPKKQAHIRGDFEEEAIPPGWLASRNLLNCDGSSAMQMLHPSNTRQETPNLVVSKKGKNYAVTSRTLPPMPALFDFQNANGSLPDSSELYNKKRISHLKGFDSKLLKGVCFGAYPPNKQPETKCLNRKSVTLPGKPFSLTKKTSLMNKIMNETKSFKKNMRAHSKKKAHVIPYVGNSESHSCESVSCDDSSESSLKMRIIRSSRAEKKPIPKLNVKIPIDKLSASTTKRISSKASSTVLKKSFKRSKTENNLKKNHVNWKRILSDSEEDKDMVTTVVSKKYKNAISSPFIPVVRLTDICRSAKNYKLDAEKLLLCSSEKKKPSKTKMPLNKTMGSRSKKHLSNFNNDFRENSDFKPNKVMSPTLPSKNNFTLSKSASPAIHSSFQNGQPLSLMEVNNDKGDAPVLMPKFSVFHTDSDTMASSKYSTCETSVFADKQNCMTQATLLSALNPVEQNSPTHNDIPLVEKDTTHLPWIPNTSEVNCENDNEIVIEEVRNTSRCKTPELICISDDDDDNVSEQNVTKTIEDLVMCFDQFQAGLLDPAEFTLIIANFKSRYPDKDIKQLVAEYKQSATVDTSSTSTIDNCSKEQAPVVTGQANLLCISCGRIATSFCQYCNLRCCYTTQCTVAHLKTCRR